MKIILILALLWVAFCSSVQASTFSGSLTIGTLIHQGKTTDINNLKNHTVIVFQYETITTNGVSKKQGEIGAGVIIDKRHILTAFHVVTDIVYNPNNATDLGAYYNTIDHQSHYLTIEKYDKDKDLALLVIENSAPDLIGNPLTLSTNITVGESIFTIGHPDQGYDLTVGTVSEIHLASAGTKIPLNANIRAGNSGGGVINSDGELIGIVLDDANFSNIGYMIGASEVQDFLRE
jgi:S1-C subfamily serine protease